MAWINRSNSRATSSPVTIISLWSVLKHSAAILAQGNSLPMMVRITVGFTPLPPEEEEKLDLVEDNFLRDEQEQEPVPDDQFTVFVRLVQSDVNPIGVRLQREASAFSESEKGL